MGKRRLPRVAVGGRVGLRPSAKDDLAALYEWRSDLLQFDLLGWLKNIVTFEEFARDMELHLRSSSSLVVVDRETDEPIGLVFAYDMNLVDGWCSVLVYAADDHRSQALGREAAFLFWDYLFRSFRLRKIYMEVFEFNHGWVESTPALEAGLLVEEGRFRDHHVFNGRPWDVTRLALYRERWMQMGGFLLALVGSEPQELPASGHEPKSEPPTNNDAALAGDALDLVSTGRLRDGTESDQRTVASNIERVRQFLAYAQEGDTAAIVDMLSKDSTHVGKVTGTVSGKRYIEMTLGDRHAMAARLGESAARERDELAWSQPTGKGNVVEITGSTRDGRKIVLQWAFDLEGNISTWSSHGPPALQVSYYLHGVASFEPT